MAINKEFIEKVVKVQSQIAVPKTDNEKVSYIIS